MTNGDRIRAMTDEEIASFFNHVLECCSDGWKCDECAFKNAGKCSEKDLLTWMQKEAASND